MSALYLGLALVCLSGWALYALSRGYAVVPGLVLTLAFGVIPLVLLSEGGRALHGGRRAPGLTALTGALALLGMAGSGAMARGMIFPGNRTPVPPTGDGVERVEYRASDGQALVGALVRAPRPDAPLVVYFHGNAESAGQNVPLARSWASRGCHVFLAEFRGYGGLTGSPSQAGLVRDGEAALRAAAELVGRDPSEVVLCGRSLGSGVASQLAGRGLGRRLILISPYTSVTDVAARIAPRPLLWLALRDPFDSQGALRARPELPLLVLHGEEDLVVPYALGRELSESHPGAELVSLPGVGHNDVFGGPREAELLRRMTGFAAVASSGQ